VISLGTSGTVYAVSATPTADPTGAVAGFADAAGAFLPLVCTLNATRVTDSFARLMGVERDVFAALALAADPAEVGPTLVPYLDGERTPNLPDARGTLFGIENTTSREALARAAHDGVLCGLLDGLDALVGCRVDVSGRRFLVGGGARSAAYRQRCADLAGASVIVPEDDETVAAGAAVQAASTIDGEHPSDVARRWGCGTGSITEPSGTDGAEVRSRYALVAGSA
jgi:xylulokinase